MSRNRTYFTEEEFKSLPDNGRKYELVEGLLEEVPTSFRDDLIVGTLLDALAPFTRGRGFVSLGQTGFRMRRPRTVCLPDLGYMRKERLPNGLPLADFGDASPDLCVEVISSSERGPRMDCKIADYFASDATYVWQMFPETRRIVVFTSPNDWTTLEADNLIDAGDLLPGFRSRVGDLFASE